MNRTSDLFAASITLFAVTSALAALVPAITKIDFPLLSQISPFFGPIPVLFMLFSIFNVMAFMTLLVSMYDILVLDELPLSHLFSPVSSTLALVFYTALFLLVANLAIAASLVA